MKRLLAFILAFVMMVGCAAAEEIDLSQYTDEQLKELRSRIDSELASRQPAKNTSNTVLMEADANGCHIILKKIWVTKDYDGTPAVGVHLIFSNKTSTARNCIFTFSVDAYQNGIELDDAYGVAEVDTSSSTTNIKDGAKIDVYWAYKLRDTTTPVEIQISKFIGGTLATKRFKFSK